MPRTEPSQSQDLFDEEPFFAESWIHANRYEAVRPGYAASTSYRSVSCSAEARFWAHNQCEVGHTRGCTRAARYELWWALALAQMAEQLWALRLALPQAVCASGPTRTRMFLPILAALKSASV